MRNFLNNAATLLTILTLMAFMPAASIAAFESGSTGADGDFAPTANTILQVPESGLFNFGTVNIPSGVTITFTKNSGNTPITILATGDITINGTISINGSNATYVVPGTGGSGGYAGGYAGNAYQTGKRGEGQGAGNGGAGIYGGPNMGASGGGGGFGGGGGGGISLAGAFSGAPSPGAGGGTYGNDALITVVTKAPEFTLNAQPNVLWPISHKDVPVTVIGGLRRLQHITVAMIPRGCTVLE